MNVKRPLAIASVASLAVVAVGTGPALATEGGSQSDLATTATVSATADGKEKASADGKEAVGKESVSISAVTAAGVNSSSEAKHYRSNLAAGLLTSLELTGSHEGHDKAGGLKLSTDLDLSADANSH